MKKKKIVYKKIKQPKILSKSKKFKLAMLILLLIFGNATQKVEQGERLFCLDRQEVHFLLEKKDCKAKKDGLTGKLSKTRQKHTDSKHICIELSPRR